MEKATEKHFATGKTLFRTGDPGGELYIIQTGTVAIYKEDQKGNRVEISQMGPGEIIGVMTVIDSRPRTATAEALTDVKVKAISRERLQRMMMSVPDWMKTIIKDLVVRVDRSNQKYMDANTTIDVLRNHKMSLIDIAAQVANGILVLSELRSAGSNKSLYLEDITAKLKGILTYDKYTINRVFDAFMNSGILKPTGSRNTVLDTDQLQDLKSLADLLVQERSERTRSEVFSLSPQDRRQLWSLVEIAEKMAIPQDKSAHISFDDLHRTHKKLVNRPFAPFAVESAASTGIVAIDREDGVAYVRFTPRKLASKLKLIDIFNRLTSKLVSGDNAA